MLMYETKSRRLRFADMDSLYFPSFIFFLKKSRFHQKRQPFRKVVLVEEELDSSGQ